MDPQTCVNPGIRGRPLRASPRIKVEIAHACGAGLREGRCSAAAYDMQHPLATNLIGCKWSQHLDMLPPALRPAAALGKHVRILLRRRQMVGQHGC